MNLQEIKTAVDEGLTVHWGNDGYVVIKGASGYLIKCLINDNYMGLTWLDGVTMNEKEEDFYIGGKHD